MYCNNIIITYSEQQAFNGKCNGKSKLGGVKGNMGHDKGYNGKCKGNTVQIKGTIGKKVMWFKCVNFMRYKESQIPEEGICFALNFGIIGLG